MTSIMSKETILAAARSVYAAQRKLTPSVKPQCRKIQRQLRPLKTSQVIFSNAAEIYSARREMSAMFVRFEQSDHTVRVESASGELKEEGLGQFPAPNLTALMAKAVVERISVHIPSFAGLERTTVWHQLRVSGGSSVSSSRELEVQLIREDESRIGIFNNNQILSTLPRGFMREQGSVLLTPLGIGIPMLFAYGFIYEYQGSGHFSPDSIQEARTYSALFALEITNRQN